MELTSYPIRGIGVEKDGQLSVIAVQNGSTKHYKVTEMSNQDWEDFYETQRAQLSKPSLNSNDYQVTRTQGTYVGNIAS